MQTTMYVTYSGRYGTPHPAAAQRSAAQPTACRNRSILNLSALCSSPEKMGCALKERRPVTSSSCSLLRMVSLYDCALRTWGHGGQAGASQGLVGQCCVYASHGEQAWHWVPEKEAPAHACVMRAAETQMQDG